MSSNKLDGFGCGGHWANSGCIRLLAPGHGNGVLCSLQAFVALWERRGDGGGWCVPHSRLQPLEEAYAGLYRRLQELQYDLSHCHYMLKGLEKAEGQQRKSTRGGDARRKFFVSLKLQAQRPLRAVANWPGFLELLEDQGLAAVSCDKILSYWLTRVGPSFRQQLVEEGIIGEQATVHHIISRHNRGIVSLLCNALLPC